MKSAAVSCVVILTMTSVGCGLCGSETRRIVESPSKTQRARVYVKDCGATTDFSLHVAMGRADGGRLVDVFVVDADHDRAPRAEDGAPRADVAWGSDSVLRIRYDSTARVFKQRTRVHGIRVEYFTDSVRPDLR